MPRHGAESDCWEFPDYGEEEKKRTAYLRPPMIELFRRRRRRAPLASGNRNTSSVKISTISVYEIQPSDRRTDDGQLSLSNRIQFITLWVRNPKTIKTASWDLKTTIVRTSYEHGEAVEFNRARVPLHDEVLEGQPSAAITEENLAPLSWLIEENIRITNRFEEKEGLFALEESPLGRSKPLNPEKGQANRDPARADFDFGHGLHSNFGSTVEFDFDPVLDFE
ncbi:hypothetical protein EVAR_62041_1 [Eumeta japonica]|uniref:Uncharacterized protein n=1 Tax=Eumeta variegata TaxID=151549 RepID=A0A4C1YN82_EUMVA|nr:hypothetical protein EVAR_62041_1 [Eumeta japonica]